MCHVGMRARGRHFPVCSASICVVGVAVLSRQCPPTPPGSFFGSVLLRPLGCPLPRPRAANPRGPHPGTPGEPRVHSEVQGMRGQGPQGTVDTWGVMWGGGEWGVAGPAIDAVCPPPPGERPCPTCSLPGCGRGRLSLHQPTGDGHHKPPTSPEPSRSGQLW